MNLSSLKAKGVKPISSHQAELQGWRLRFNVQHFFRHEGGVGNIEYTGNSHDRVLGLVHECQPEALPLLDAAEAFGHGYDRIEVGVKAKGQLIKAVTYIGMPAFINEKCKPSQRYLNIVAEGARTAGLAQDYVAQLASHPVHQPEAYPPFIAPQGDFPSFSEAELSERPLYTGLWGYAFDMTSARPTHEFLKSFFGGRDMTLFHLKRMDTSTQDESLDQLRKGHLNQAQRDYLHAYLHEYAREYRFAGYINYD